MGFIFVLDRLTGKPLFPVEERPVPQSNVPGEATWPTQPFPVALPKHLSVNEKGGRASARPSLPHKSGGVCTVRR
jgi:glucose dehydrogenase